MAMDDGSYFKNPAFLDVMNRVKQTDVNLHILGIVSFFSSHGSYEYGLELLKMAKEFAKECRSRPECRLPDEVATMLYVLSIVVAMTSGHRITKLDRQGLRHVLDWALDQAWIDEPTRRLLREGGRAIGRMEPESDA